MESVSLNWLAILVAAIAHFMLGGLWYSPVMFAKPFMRAIGKTPEELSEGSSPAMYVKAFIGGFIKSAGIAVVLAWIGELAVLEAAAIGAFIGLFIHGVADHTNALFEGRSHTLVGISVGYDTVGLALASAIIVAIA